MMLAARGAFLAARRKQALPYDSEVEYLESTGTQWIDTGVCGSSGLVFTLDAFFKNIPGKAGTGAFGFCDRWKVNCRALYNFNNYNCVEWTTNFTYNKYGGNGIRKTFICSNKEFTVVGYGTTAFNATNITTSANVGLFTVLTPSGSPSSNGMSAFMCYGFSINDGNGNVVLDMTPVRFTNEQGLSEGAMYDRLGVGGMNPDGSARTDGLYRNRGDGAFVIGPDKTA